MQLVVENSDGPLAEVTPLQKIGIKCVSTYGCLFHYVVLRCDQLNIIIELTFHTAPRILTYSNVINRNISS
jgi:hypothetical protein